MTIMESAHHIATPDWTIRPERPIDLDQIHELHRIAFGGPTEADLVDAIRASSDFIPELSLVAVTSDESVLGHVLLSLVAFEPAAADDPTGSALALAPLAVLPPHAGRGIGSALVRLALEIADARSESMTAVLGAPAFYGRFGFTPAASSQIHSAYDGAGDAFQVRALGTRPLRPGTIVYPPSFRG